MSQSLSRQVTGRWIYGLLLAFFCAVLWGILPVVMKLIVKEMDAASIVWIRMLVAVACLGTVLLWKGSLPKLHLLPKAHLLTLLICSICMAANFFFFMDSLNWVSPANAQLFIQLGPVFMAVGAMLFFGERFTKIQWLAQVVLFVGFYMFFSDQLLHQESHTSSSYMYGVFLVILAAITWAGYALLQKQMQGKLTPPQILFVLYFSSVLIFTPFAKPVLIFELSTTAFFALLFASLNTIFAYGAFAESLRHWHASRISAVLAITPVITLGTAAIAHSFFPAMSVAELIDPVGLAGAIIVVLSSSIIALAKS